MSSSGSGHGCKLKGSEVITKGGGDKKWCWRIASIGNVS